MRFISPPARTWWARWSGPRAPADEELAAHVLTLQDGGQRAAAAVPLAAEPDGGGSTGAGAPGGCDGVKAQVGAGAAL